MKAGENWRSDFKRIYRDFSIVNSASYRASSAIIMAAMNQQQQQQQALNGTEITASASQSDFLVSSNSIKGSFTMATLPENAVAPTGTSKKASSSQFLKVPQINDGKLFKNGSNHHSPVKSESSRSKK